ncbi:YfjI family protein [Chitinibacter sp. S2-10]|uniref:YfjI family protein n=1 Tax=Chitinibacter sp. S2-10 TaxID=3373597 RepID=UPI0039774119
MIESNFQPKPPIHVLPSLARDAAWEAVTNMQSPEALPFSSALLAMTLCCQHLIDVRRLAELNSPCTQYFLTVAESGERKTAIDNLFMRPFTEYESEAQIKYETLYKEYLIEYQAWEIERNGLAKQLARTTLNDEEKTQAKRAFKAHAAMEPVKPVLYRTLYTDASKEALILSMQENWPSAALVSNEADEVLNGQAMRSFAIYNSLWDGSDIAIDRKSDVPIRLRDARLSISLLLQPVILQKFLSNRGEEAKGSGLLARFHVCFPSSTQGTRFIHNPTQSWEHLPKFHQRVRELLEQSQAADLDASKRITLQFTTEAQQFWISEYNAFEKEVSPGGSLVLTKEHAAKSADNMARLAAIFHFFEGHEGDINLESIQAASAVIRWYEDEFVRLFVPPAKPPQEESDAFDLEFWLRGGQHNGVMNGWRYIRKNFIRQHCPNHLREKNRLNLALSQLVKCQRITFFSNGKTTFVDLLPWLQFDHPHWLAAIEAFKSRD